MPNLFAPIPPNAYFPQSYIILGVGISMNQLEAFPNLYPFFINLNTFSHFGLLINGEVQFVGSVSQVVNGWSTNNLVGAPPSGPGIYIYDRVLGIVDRFYTDTEEPVITKKTYDFLKYYRKNLYVPYAPYGVDSVDFCNQHTPVPIRSRFHEDTSEIMQANSDLSLSNRHDEIVFD